MFAFLPGKGINNSYSKGFTLIELLVVIAILAIIFISVLAQINRFGRTSELDGSTDIIISTLEVARTQTVASNGATVYGVHFESDKIVLFTGSTYSSVDPSNIEKDLFNTEIFSINLQPSGSDVIFDRIRGTTFNFGDVQVRSIVDTSRTKTIVINAQGQAGLDDTVSPTGTRIADTRHINFSACSSIQSATTLTLTFTDTPVVVKNISMASFFNVGKTKFDWEDETDVNGSDQTVRIHSSDTSSLISVHRDQRYNDKALAITIDGVTLVTYAADGTATIGSLCGGMTAQ